MPRHKREAILSLLHAGHSGIAKTATQLYYWPNMKTDIEHSVANCSSCQANRQSNPRPKLDSVCLPEDAKQPMLHAACDLFSATGKQWLALVDRFSGYVWTTALRKTDTKAIIALLEQRSAVQVGVQGVLHSTRHHTRAILPIQPGKQRTSRSSS